MFGWMDYLAPGMVAHAVLVLSVVAALGLVFGSLGFKGFDWGSSDLLGMAYAIAYPFGVVGIILTMLLIEKTFRFHAEPETEELDSSPESNAQALDAVDLQVTNPNCDGITIGNLPFRKESGIVFSRLLTDGRVTVPEDDSVIHVGDTLRLVGPRAKLSQFETVIGQKSRVNLSDISNEIGVERLHVTKREVLGKSLGDLNFEHYYGTVGTRLNRAGIQLAASGSVHLQFGDLLTVVGPKEGVAKVAELVGNRADVLEHPHVLPVFVGIMLGVLVGNLPIGLPGMPAPVRLGLAGGPLLVALCLSRIGRVGPLIWYLVPGASLALREIGIVLFLACVGLKSGGRFLEMLLSQSGLSWLAAGALLTFVPLALIGFLARVLLRIDYPTICGVLAGSMTDPPALAFASNITKSDRPLVAYAAVYPLVMILRVFLVQILVLTLPV